MLTVMEEVTRILSARARRVLASSSQGADFSIIIFQNAGKFGQKIMFRCLDEMPDSEQGLAKRGRRTYDEGVPWV
jgi:hypothetical protein